jgi:hypothetical protein
MGTSGTNKLRRVFLMDTEKAKLLLEKQSERNKRSLAETMAIAQDEARIRERKRKMKKEREETENLAIIEIVKGFDLTSEKLLEILTTAVKAQDGINIAETRGGIIPVQAVTSAVGTVPKKSVHEKESDDNER